MGDKRRFDLFAALVARNFNPSHYATVADIASGKGKLQYALRGRGYHRVVSFDKRKKHNIRPSGYNFQHRYFSESVKENFSLLVGMHPDEATDVIIVEAAKRGVPFVVCPCCVKPSALPFWGPHKYNAWMKHLRLLADGLNFMTAEAQLKMSGRNVCLIGRPQ